jgi:hypothetical protein
MLAFSDLAIAQSVDFKAEKTRVGESDNNTVYKTFYRRGKNLPAYDERRIHYGFYVGTNVSTFAIEPSQNFVNQLKDSVFAADSSVFTSINHVPNIGFTTGFIFNVRLSENLDFRILPSVSFFSRFVEFKRRDGREFNMLNKFTFSFIELPMLFKFKSQRRHNTRAYLLAGIKPSWEVGSRRDEQGIDELRANSSDFSVDLGGGFDFYYPYFKFSPEVRFSFGLSDLKYPDNNKFARAVGRMNTYTVSFILNFE